MMQSMIVVTFHCGEYQSRVAVAKPQRKESSVVSMAV